MRQFVLVSFLSAFLILSTALAEECTSQIIFHDDLYNGCLIKEKTLQFTAMKTFAFNELTRPECENFCETKALVPVPHRTHFHPTTVERTAIERIMAQWREDAMLFPAIAEAPKEHYLMMRLSLRLFNNPLYDDDAQMAEASEPQRNFVLPLDKVREVGLPEIVQNHSTDPCSICWGSLKEEAESGEKIVEAHPNEAALQTGVSGGQASASASGAPKAAMASTARHLFCLKCLQGHYRLHQNCPLCKRAILPNS